MDKEMEFGLAVFGELAKRAEPFLDAAMKERGVSSPRELPQQEASEILENALVAAAVRHFPGSNVAKLKIGFRNAMHPAFSRAVQEVRGWQKNKIDVFEPAAGLNTAIVLAAFGIPVSPIDKKDGHVLAAPSSDLSLVEVTCSPETPPV
jgi:hypothetical protein